MKFIISLLLLIVLAVSGFAYTDLGLNKSKKTLGFYLMPSSDGRHVSSGLIYNENQGEGAAVEALYTSYRSPYLITSNITKLNIHKKIRLSQLGPVGFTALVGGGALYSPAVGGGLVGDLGGVFSLMFNDELAIGVPLFFSIYNDGFSMNLFGDVYYRPAFFNGFEVFGGPRIEADIVGSLGSFGGTDFAGKVSTYIMLGLRNAI